MKNDFRLEGGVLDIGKVRIAELKCVTEWEGALLRTLRGYFELSCFRGWLYS